MSDLYNMVETLKYRGLVVKMYDGTVIASGDNNGVDEVPVLGFREATFFIYCSALTDVGAQSALITIQSKNPNPLIDVYDDLVAFTAITAALAHEKKDVSANLGSRLSLKWALTDISSFTFSVFAVLKI